IYLAAYVEDVEKASKANSELFEVLKKLKAEKDILSFNSIGEVLLSEEEQKAKINAWNSFWTESKIEALKGQMILEGKKIGFKENTFQPFFNVLEETYTEETLYENELLQALFLGEFISSEKGLTTITSVIKT